MLAGHETLLHVTQLQVVHLKHVLLLFLLQGATDQHNYSNARKEAIFLKADFVLKVKVTLTTLWIQVKQAIIREIGVST